MEAGQECVSSLSMYLCMLQVGLSLELTCEQPCNLTTVDEKIWAM